MNRPGRYRINKLPNMCRGPVGDVLRLLAHCTVVGAKDIEAVVIKEASNHYQSIITYQGR